MEFSIFGAAAPIWNKTSYTGPISIGTRIEVESTTTIWLKALRFYRPSTTVYGTIRAALYKTYEKTVVPGTAVSVTLPNGAGGTGWVTLTLPSPIVVPNGEYRVVVFFPGGSGNGYPQNRSMPIRYDGSLSAAYWSGGCVGQYGWRNGPLTVQEYETPSPVNTPSMYVTGGAGTTYPTTKVNTDHGIDMVVTDTDPNPVVQSGPKWTLQGQSAPNLQVGIAAGAAVAGLEFIPQQQMWVTSLRVYRPQGLGLNHPQFETGAGALSSGRPISGPNMHSYSGSADHMRAFPSADGIDLRWAATGALYRLAPNGTATQIPGTAVSFPTDTINGPFGPAFTYGIHGGWVEGYLSSPVRLEANEHYRVAVGFRSGRPVTTAYFASGGAGATGLSAGPLQAPASALATNGSASTLIAGQRALANPTTATTANPWLDVAVTTQNPSDPREPGDPVRLWGIQPPNTALEIGVGSRTVGLEFSASEACTAYGLRYYRHQGINASAGRLYAVSDQPSGLSTGTVVVGSEVTFPSASSDGWQFAPFRVPIRLAQNQRFRIAVRFPAGYVYTDDYFGVGLESPGRDGITSGILTVPADTEAVDTTNGSYSIPDQYPDQTFSSSNPWIDVTVAAGGDTRAGPPGTAGEPSNALRLWGVDPPATVTVSKRYTRSVGLEFMVERAATAHGYRFYRPDTTLGGPVQARLYSVGDGEHGTEVVGADTTFTLDDSSTGWMWAPLRDKVALVGGRRYRLVLFFPDGFPTTPGWYVDGQPAVDIDQQAGILRAFSVNNATRRAQPVEQVGGVESDAVVYPSKLATDNPWIDITVTDGDTDANTMGEAPAGAMRAWGVDDPTGGDIVQDPNPVVAGHQVTLSQGGTVWGLRMWRPDLRQGTTTARVYRVDTATTVSGTQVTFPRSTSRGWVYVPFPTPVGLEANVAYRIAVAHPLLGPSSPNRLTSPITSGVVTTQSAWTADTAELTYPATASDDNYWLDLSVVPGAAVAEDTLTLFPSTPDATVTVRADNVSTRGTTFAGQREDFDSGRELLFWVKAIRFWRPTTAVGGVITGRIYEVTTTGHAVPVPHTDVVFNLSGTGWQTAELPFPVALSQRPWYRVAVHFPNGYPVSTGYFTTGPGGQTRYGPNGTIYAAHYGYTGGDGINGAWLAGPSLTYPNKGTAAGPPYGENYWVDIVATTSEPATAPPALPRFPLSYSQFGQISSTTAIIGETITYSQVAFNTAPGPRSVGVEFTVDTPAYLHSYRFPRLSSVAQARPVAARLYRVTGPTSGMPVPGSDTTATLSADYWQAGWVTPAVPLVPGQRYKAVFLFLDSTPVGVGHDATTDRLRGPLRVFANIRATGGSTCTVAGGSAMTYPTEPPTTMADAFSSNTPVVDVWVSPGNPQETQPSVRSVFDNRRPADMVYQGWPVENSYIDWDGNIVNPPTPPAGFTAGMEFYTTTDTCFLRSYKYWRAPYPVVTQLTEMRLYRVTGTQTGNYYAPADADFDVSTGTLVPGTTITLPEWTSDLNQTESYAEGWVTVTLPAPIPLQQGQRYRVAAWYPRLVGNRYAPATASRPVTNFYWKTGPGGSGIVDGPLIAPSATQATAGTQGSVESRYDDMRYPSAGVRSNRAHYWIDVEVLDTAPRNVDGGVVTVQIPTLADDPRRGGYRSSSYVNPYLAVTATASTARHTATAPLAVPLDVQARARGGRTLSTVDVNVTGSAGGTKGADGQAVYPLAMQYRQAAPRPKGVADTVTAQVAPQVSGRSSIRWSAMPRPPDLFQFVDGATELRFIAQNILTRRFLHWDLPIVNPTLTWRLSGPFELTGSLNPAYIDLLDLDPPMDEWSTFIHVELQGQIVGTGIVMPWSARGEELSVDCVGIASYPHGIPYMDIYEEFFPDIMMVVREMWRHIQSFPDGNLGVQLPEGYMGVPLYGDGVYDTQTGEFLGWKKWALHWTDFVDCGSFMDELAASTPYDYIEVHQWAPNKTDVLHGINFYYPRAGSKRLELRFAEGENIVEAVPISEPDDAYASDIIIKGAGEGFTQVFAWVGSPLWDRLRRVAVITDEQVQTVEVAQGMAIQELVRRLYLRGVDTIVVEAFSPLASFGSYNVGDDILIEGMIPWVGNFGLWHRIVSMSLQPEAGLATLEVQRSEAFRYGREITYSK